MCETSFAFGGLFAFAAVLVTAIALRFPLAKKIVSQWLHIRSGVLSFAIIKRNIICGPIGREWKTQTMVSLFSGAIW